MIGLVFKHFLSHILWWLFSCTWLCEFVYDGHKYILVSLSTISSFEMWCLSVCIVVNVIIFIISDQHLTDIVASVCVPVQCLVKDTSLWFFQIFVVVVLLQNSVITHSTMTLWDSVSLACVLCSTAEKPRVCSLLGFASLGLKTWVSLTVGCSVP